jgi:hypothetical protein
LKVAFTILSQRQSGASRGCRDCLAVAFRNADVKELCLADDAGERISPGKPLHDRYVVELRAG